MQFVVVENPELGTAEARRLASEPLPPHACGVWA